MAFPYSLTTTLQQKEWWLQLEPQWQRVFQEAFFRHLGIPTEEELATLCSTTVLRLAGPTAPHPNTYVELTNLSGVSQLTHLQILIVVHHQLDSLKEIEPLTQINKLFVNNNAITSLEGVEKLHQLEQIYCQANKISSLKPLEKLKNLKEAYVCLNELTSLEGLTKQHSKNLKNLYCLPNEHLPQKEILRVERQLSIRCLRG